MNIAQPDYYERFFCIGAACEDTCCKGMGVVVDKPTFEKYQRCDDPLLGPLLHLKVLPNPRSTSQSTYATVVLDGATCPFLEPSMDCLIQVKLGEEYLSRACDTYPRAMSKVDDTLERSLYLSCPEAARIILLRSSQIRFSNVTGNTNEKYKDFPTIDTGDGLFGGKPYQHLSLIRNFVNQLLGDRSLAVWERLTILGMYCDQLSRIPKNELEHGTPLLTASFSANLSGRQFDDTLAGILSNKQLLLNVVISSVEDRLSSGYTSPRFIECYQAFIEGIRYRDNIDTDSLAAQYSDVQKEWYDPFMASREYIWENYLVSKSHKEQFPLGPQRSLYQEVRTIYQEYVILAISYVFVRTLLTGLAGHAKESLSQEDIVKLVQSFSRAVDHDIPYLTKLLRSLEQGKIADLPTLATLLKP